MRNRLTRRGLLGMVGAAAALAVAPKSEPVAAAVPEIEYSEDDWDYSFPNVWVSLGPPISPNLVIYNNVIR